MIALSRKPIWKSVSQVSNRTLEHISYLSTCTLLQTQSQYQEKTKAHQYQLRWQFKDVPSTSKYLLGQILYNKDGVVAINKPANLGSSNNECSIYHSLPCIAKELGYKQLILVFVPEKSISGVTILAADNHIAQAVKKAVRRSKTLYSNDPRQTFLAVTVGQPILEDGNQQYAVTKEHKEKTDFYMVLQKWSINSVKRREVNNAYAAHKVLSKSELASLVSISTWQYRKHFPRVFLSDILLSPALGDQEYGRRVGSLFGKKILLKPWNAPAVVALPPPLLQALSLRSGSERFIPLHFHLHELNLHSFTKHKEDLILQAEPPDYFKWTCQKLKLDLPNQSVRDLTEVVQQSADISNEICKENEDRVPTSVDKF